MSIKTWIDEDGIIRQDYVLPPPPQWYKKVWWKLEDLVQDLWDSGAILLIALYLAFAAIGYVVLRLPQVQALMNTPISEVPFGTVLFVFIFIYVMLRK